MSNRPNWIDRLRIERRVWLLDQRLYELPRASRIAKRREVRQNLTTASMDIGTTQALRNLGDGQTLADEYLRAEFGDRPRHSWIAATVFALTSQLILTSLFTEAAQAFSHGITATDPHASGTYTWSGIAYLQDTVTYTAVNGEVTFVGGAWTPVSWVLWIAATVMIGRLWHVRLRRRPKTDEISIEPAS